MIEGRVRLQPHGNWRLTFSFDGEDEDAVLVDYQDYHQERET